MTRTPRGLTLIELMVVLAVIALVAAIAVPGLRRARISANEASAIATLHAIARAQEAMRQAVVVDQDADGLGEFGYLQELTGEAAPRGAPPRQARRAFLEALAREGGVGVRDGYCVLVYLPTLAEPAPETSPLPAADPARADVQELRFVAYAWPVERGTTGIRAFAIDQNGVLYATTNRGQRYSGLVRIPAATAAYDLAGESPITLDAPLGGRGKGVGDQQSWEPFSG